MPCLVRQIALNDSSLPVPDRHAESLADASRFEDAEGVYAVFATWNGHRVVSLSQHLDRLEDSAQRAGLRVSLNRSLLCAALRELIQDSGFREVRARISLSPGPRVMMSVEPYTGPPLDLRKSGVSCATVLHRARENPLVKQTRWIHERTSLRTTGPEFELLIADVDGCILEGTRSNFYVVLPGPVLKTAEEGILPGIARSLLLDVAAGLLEIQREAPTRADLGQCLEAFLTSASRGVIPVVTIDGKPVGAGRTGPITTELILRYDERAKELEERL